MVLACGICNGIDYDRFSLVDSQITSSLQIRLDLQHNVKVSGYVERLVRDKKISESLDAYTYMHAQNRQILLLLAGGCKNGDPVPERTRTLIANHPYGYRTSRRIRTAAHAAASGSFIHPSILGRRKWFQQLSYDGAVLRAEDYEPWIRSAPHSRFEVLDEALLLYRERGLPYLRKYLKSSAGTRQVLRTYRSQPGMGIPTTRLITQSYVKDVAYRIYSLLGQEDELLTRRNRPLTASEEQEARQILSTLTPTGDTP